MITSLRPKSTAIAWLTHFYDAESQTAFNRLAAEAGSYGEVFQFRDGLELLEQESFDRIIALSKDEIAKASPQRYAARQKLMRPGRKHVSGYLDILVMAIAARLEKYDYIWFIESDVDFTGDWSTFFEAFADCEADLLGAHIRPRWQTQDWAHWPSFGAPSSLNVSAHTKGFFPIARFSRLFLRTYPDELRNGWKGHFEALWPTIALHRGLQVEAIGGQGLFVPRSRYGRWYTQGPGCLFRYRPSVAERYYPTSEMELPPDQLCHPIKTAKSRLASAKEQNPAETSAPTRPIADVGQRLSNTSRATSFLLSVFGNFRSRWRRRM